MRSGHRSGSWIGCLDQIDRAQAAPAVQASAESECTTPLRAEHHFARRWHTRYGSELVLVANFQRRVDLPAIVATTAKHATRLLNQALVSPPENGLHDAVVSLRVIERSEDAADELPRGRNAHDPIQPAERGGGDGVGFAARTAFVFDGDAVAPAMHRPVVLPGAGRGGARRDAGDAVELRDGASFPPC